MNESIRINVAVTIVLGVTAGFLSLAVAAEPAADSGTISETVASEVAETVKAPEPEKKLFVGERYTKNPDYSSTHAMTHTVLTNRKRHAACKIDRVLDSMGCRSRSRKADCGGQQQNGQVSIILFI